MLSLASLMVDYPDETAHRMMVRHGSGMLLRALRGEPEPTRPTRAILYRGSESRYVPVGQRHTLAAPRAVRDILTAVADAFDMPEQALVGRGKSNPEKLARSVAIRLIRDRTWQNGEPIYSTITIGGFFKRDHSTICHALSMFETYCKNYPQVGEIYAELRERLG